MREKSISKVSNAIAKELDHDSTIDEFEFAITEIKNLLKYEKSREELTRTELIKSTYESHDYTFDLEEYLSQIEENILKLDDFLEVLSTKKRLLEIRLEENTSFTGCSNL